MLSPSTGKLRPQTQQLPSKGAQRIWASGKLESDSESRMAGSSFTLHGVRSQSGPGAKTTRSRRLTDAAAASATQCVGQGSRLRLQKSGRFGQHDRVGALPAAVLQPGLLTQYGLSREGSAGRPADGGGGRGQITTDSPVSVAVGRAVEADGRQRGQPAGRSVSTSLLIFNPAVFAAARA